MYPIGLKVARRSLKRTLRKSFSTPQIFHVPGRYNQSSTTRAPTPADARSAALFARTTPDLAPEFDTWKSAFAVLVAAIEEVELPITIPQPTDVVAAPVPRAQATSTVVLGSSITRTAVAVPSIKVPGMTELQII
jgi:hypothetical protein